MTDTDAPLPPDELDEPAPTEEETQAANALREALEGRRAGTHLPEPALETAALLRFNSERGRLAQDRQAGLRAELMASLAATPASHKQTRKGLRHWLGLGFTLAGGATAVIVLGVFGARQLSTPEAREEAPSSNGLSSTTTPSASEGPASSVGQTAATAPAAPPPPAAPQRSAANSESAKEQSGAEAEPAAPANATRARVARVETESPAFAAKGEAARAGSGSGALGGAGALDARRERLALAPAELNDDEGGAPTLGALPQAPAAEAKKAAPQAQPAQPALPTEQVRRESDKYRAELLAELADPNVDGAYGELDRAQSPAELEHARQRLGALASGSFGGSKANAERLRPDIYCKLAELALRLGQPQAALDWARKGLALGAPASPFVARLYLLEGQAKSALGDRNGAARSYLKAIEVNEQLLDQSLEAP